MDIKANDQAQVAPWYDSEAGIQDALTRGLLGFSELCSERSVAGYKRRESLADWVIFGKYYLDRCGNTLPIDDMAEPPGRPILQMAENVHFTASFRPIATHDIVCDRCGHAWTLRDAHDYRPINGVIHMHASCRRFRVAEQARVDAMAIVREAGIEGELLAVPNRYGSEDYNGPWFVVRTEKLGRVTVGWRRRVLQISWEHGPDGCKIFAKDGVTHDGRLVHAWGISHATEYLLRLLSAAADSALY